MDDDEDNAELEWKLRAAAIPVAFALALVFNLWPAGHWLQRTFLSMMVHELGHAATGWACGFASIPTLWKTTFPETRTMIITLASVAGLGFLGWRGWVTERMRWCAAAIVGLLLVFFGTTSSVDDAYEAFTFGGDAGAMILGSALTLTMFAPAASRLRTNQLRWGFLVIGAAAYVDTFATWWRARTNEDVIPFGDIEGVGLSDPSKLQDTFGWTTRALVDRYVMVGAICGAVITVVWLYSTWQMYRRARPSA
jgi:hypothetical protein